MVPEVPEVRQVPEGRKKNRKEQVPGLLFISVEEMAYLRNRQSYLVPWNESPSRAIFCRSNRNAALLAETSYPSSAVCEINRSVYQRSRVANDVGVLEFDYFTPQRTKSSTFRRRKQAVC